MRVFNTALEEKKTGGEYFVGIHLVDHGMMMPGIPGRNKFQRYGDLAGIGFRIDVCI
jgi:hypothetical protein